MNNDVDIFKEVGEAKWFYFKEVGDAIQGTYIGVSEGKDQFKNEQMIYTLKDKEGKIWNIGIRKTSGVVVDEMAKAKFGQIVGLKFAEERDSSKSPTGKTRIIKVFQRPDLVDREWMDENRLSLEHSAPTAPKSFLDTSDVPFESTKRQEPVVVEPQKVAISETHQALRNLAITRGLNEETMSDKEQDSRIESISGLSLSVESNIPMIIMKLSEYKKI